MGRQCCCEYVHCVLLQSGWSQGPLPCVLSDIVRQAVSLRERLTQSSLITILCTFVAPWIIETQGRRRPILIAGVVMVITLFTMGGMLKSSAVGSTGLGIGLITVACVWELFYASTLGVIGYVYLGETSTVLLRAKTTGVAAAGTGVLNLVSRPCLICSMVDRLIPYRLSTTVRSLDLGIEVSTDMQVLLSCLVRNHSGLHPRVSTDTV